MSTMSGERGAHAAASDDRSRETPGPPPAGGVLWDLADIRMLLTLPAAMALQVAHPAVGAGVEDHSVYRTDPWGRAQRSLASAQLWIYGGSRATEEGRRLREMHRDIAGTDTRGRPYRALDPDCYGWVHATGFPVFRHAQRYLGRPFDDTAERRLYAEWSGIGRLLGLRDEDMPPTREAFWPYYRRMLDEQLELTTVVRELTATDRPVPPPDLGPSALRVPVRLLWPVLRPPLLRFRRFVTIGFIPPDARAAIGLPWTARQERRLRRLGRVLRHTVPLLPDRLRYLPLAYRARRAYARGG